MRAKNKARKRDFKGECLDFYWIQTKFILLVEPKKAKRKIAQFENNSMVLWEIVFEDILNKRAQRRHWEAQIENTKKSRFMCNLIFGIKSGERTTRKKKKLALRGERHREYRLMRDGFVGEENGEVGKPNGDGDERERNEEVIFSWEG